MKHSLKLIFSESSGVQDFVGVLWADETELVHCNTNLNKAEPKPNWLKDFMQSNQEHNDLYTQECLHSKRFFKDTLNVLRRSCSQTEGTVVKIKCSEAFALPKQNKLALISSFFLPSVPQVFTPFRECMAVNGTMRLKRSKVLIDMVMMEKTLWNLTRRHRDGSFQLLVLALSNTS